MRADASSKCTQCISGADLVVLNLKLVPLKLKVLLAVEGEADPDPEVPIKLLPHPPYHAYASRLSFSIFVILFVFLTSLPKKIEYLSLDHNISPIWCFLVYL